MTVKLVKTGVVCRICGSGGQIMARFTVETEQPHGELFGARLDEELETIHVLRGFHCSMCGTELYHPPNMSREDAEREAYNKLREEETRQGNPSGLHVSLNIAGPAPQPASTDEAHKGCGCHNCGDSGCAKSA